MGFWPTFCPGTVSGFAGYFLRLPSVCCAKGGHKTMSPRRRKKNRLKSMPRDREKSAKRDPRLIGFRCRDRLFWDLSVFSTIFFRHETITRPTSNRVPVILRAPNRSFRSENPVFASASSLCFNFACGARKTQCERKKEKKEKNEAQRGGAQRSPAQSTDGKTDRQSVSQSVSVVGCVACLVGSFLPWFSSLRVL